VFKRAFNKLKEKLEEEMGSSAAKVEYNPRGKPRKGTFEVKANGQVVVSFVGMARPFRNLREMDYDEVVADLKKALEA